MKILVKKPEKVFHLIDVNGNRKSVAKHNMNCKADKKLMSVAMEFEDTIPDYCKVDEQQFLCKVLKLQNCHPLERILLVYDMENRFAAISYNLLLQSFLKAEESKDYRFELQYDGIVRMRDVRFICTTRQGNDISEREQKILHTLNELIILKKIKELNLLHVVLQYSKEDIQWKISVKTLAGSATWLLIPPMMNVIMPKRQEIYSLVELMRMLASAVIKKD